MGYPETLQNKVSKIQVSSNDFRLTANRDTVKSGGILTMPLPNNGIIDIKSFFVSALASTTTTVGTANLARWAPIFSRIIIDIGSNSLNSCQYLPEVQTALNQVASSYDVRNRKNVYGAGRPIAVVGANQTDEPLVIDSFPGTFLDSSSTTLIDMSLLPDTKIHFYISGPESALVATAGATDVAFDLKSVYGSVRSYAINDGGLYYEGIYKYLMGSNDTKDITWKNYMTTLNTTQLTSTTCLDVQSNSVAKAFFLPLVQQGTLSNTLAGSGTSGAYTRNVPDNLKWQFSLNGITVPLAQSSVSDAYTMTLNTFGHKYKDVGSIDALCNTRQLWQTPYFVGSASFEMPVGESKPSQHWNSGYNTMDSCSKLSVTLSGDNACGVTSVLLVVETNPVLKIGANKSFNVLP